MKLLVPFFALLFLASCAPVQSVSSIESTTSRQTEIISTGVIQHPVIAEMDVAQQKDSATLVLSAESDLFTGKRAALTKLQQQSRSDLVVSPSYRVTENDDETVITAYGYPAKYTEFRNMTQEDVPLVEVGAAYVVPTDEAELVTITQDRPGGGRNNGLIALGGFVVGILAILGLSQ